MSKIRRYSNTATDTTLNGAITAGSTSLLVNDDSNYPTNDFTIAVDNEIILVTDRTGTTFAGLERGYDNTIPASHIDTANVAHKAIADDFSYRWEDTLTTPTWHSLDDEFGGDTISADWTEVTPTGTVTWTQARGVISALFATQTANDCVGLVRNMGSLVPPVYLYTACRVMGGNENYLMAGPLFADGTTTTSNVVWFMPYRGYIDADENSHTASLRAGTFTNISSALTTASLGFNVSGWLHLRLDWVNSDTWRAWVSSDGVSWTSLGWSNQTSTMTPTHVGLGVSTWNPSQTLGSKMATFDTFRVYETKPTFWSD